MARSGRDGGWLTPFLAGVVATGAGWVLSHALSPRRRGLDPRLFRDGDETEGLSPVVVVPGIMGSGLRRPDGTPVWLNLRNAIGSFNLSLPLTLPLTDSKDDLEPGELLIGTDGRVPRMFGFTEYYDLLEILQAAGFRPAVQPADPGPVYYVFSYDWRRDLIEAAKRLHEMLERLAEERGNPDARFNLVCHSMGGLVARYYMRYGAAEPDENMPVTWAGARRIRNLVTVATPNGGAIHALEGLLYGSKVGLSFTTMAAPVISRMPAVYQLLPPREAGGLLDHTLQPLDADLHDAATWRRLGWGPFAPSTVRRLSGFTEEDAESYPPYLEAVLGRAAALHRALARPPVRPCPTRVIVVGGDCLPTLARALVPEKEGLPPRFEPRNKQETEAMLEAGDGRVTRASLLSSHLTPHHEHHDECGIPEASQVLIGSADHHGIYREPTFQSILLRILLRPEKASASVSRAADSDHYPRARASS